MSEEPVIAAVSTGVPRALREIITLGRTLKKRAGDVLAYFDRPGTSNGPTEAINLRSAAVVMTRGAFPWVDLRGRVFER